MKKTIIIIAVTSTLSGCLGSSTVTPTIASAPSGTTYQNLNSTAAATSALGGDTIRMNSTTEGISLATVSGSLDHKTKKHTFDDGKIALTDNNGFNADTLPKLVDDNDATLTISSPTTTDSGITGTYDYVRLYEANYTDPISGEAIQNVGYFGVVTATADIPSTGKAAYAGGAAGITENKSTDVSLDLFGTSIVQVDFGTKYVQALIQNITAKTTGENPVDAISPVDTITVLNMEIKENRFRGGSILTILNETPVSLTGTGTPVDVSQGTFFGYDTASSIPDEVAGLISRVGNGGNVAINYISD